MKKYFSDLLNMSPFQSGLVCDHLTSSYSSIFTRHFPDQTIHLKSNMSTVKTMFLYPLCHPLNLILSPQSKRSSISPMIQDPYVICWVSKLSISKDSVS